MLAQAVRDSVVKTCRRLAESPLSVGMSGNVSVRDRESGLIAISPSAMDYRRLEAADVVLLTLAGEQADGDRRPSSEAPMHLTCYRRRADINALVHTHSVAATTLAVLGRSLPAVHYMIALAGSDEIPLAPYHRFGSVELAEAAVDAMDGGLACLLANHGLLAAGTDLEAAWTLAEQIEFCAEVYLRAAAVGEPQLLSPAQISDVATQLGAYTRQ